MGNSQRCAAVAAAAPARVVETAATALVQRAKRAALALHCRWRAALAKGQRLGSRRPQREARGRRRSSTSHARGSQLLGRAFKKSISYIRTIDWLVIDRTSMLGSAA